MASSSEVRSWWSGYQHNFDRYVLTEFPGPEGQVWNLYVADRSKPIWEAVAQIMETEPYLFRESAGGTYSERDPESVSLHTYALALDLNPTANPMRPPPLVYDYPETFIQRMEGIRAEGQQALMWGGRWPASNPPDTMHWQINVPPSACDSVTWDKGDDDDMPLSDQDIEKVAKRAAELVWQKTFSTDTGPQAAGWILGQGYALNQRAVRTTDKVYADTQALLKEE